MNPMILDREHCEQLSLIPDRTTAIIATCQSQMPCFMWSILSLLLRSQHKYLEHIIVVINGPDSRTGDPTLQDKKQQFLEELRGMKWRDRDMPLTVARVWSRVGHCQSIEMAIPWVHTETYTLMHDDTILLKTGWEEIVRQTLGEDAAIAIAPPTLTGGLMYSEFEGKQKLGLPHLNSFFLVARKAKLTGSQWHGYHLPYEFTLPEGLLEYHKKQLGKPSKTFPEKYGFVNMDAGAWVFHDLQTKGLKIKELPPDLTDHLTAMSWSNRIEKLREVHQVHIRELQTLIAASEYNGLYQKYL